jgi:hypothetical protein
MVAGLVSAAHAAEPIEGSRTRTIQIDGQDVTVLEITPDPVRPMNSASPIPEPSQMAMYGLAVAGLLYRRFRRPTREATS